MHLLEDLVDVDLVGLGLGLGLLAAGALDGLLGGLLGGRLGHCCSCVGVLELGSEL